MTSVTSNTTSSFLTRRLNGTSEASQNVPEVDTINNITGPRDIRVPNVRRNRYPSCPNDPVKNDKKLKLLSLVYRCKRGDMLMT